MSSNAALDERMMRRCIELAAAAGESNNSPVGCVIGLEGRVIAEAEERSPAGDDPFAHAEILAIREVLRSADRERLAAATLYTTNEPCFLCSYAIREARIGRVVFAVETKGIGGATSEHPILASNRVERWGPAPLIEAGLLEAECLTLQSRLRAEPGR